MLEGPEGWSGATEHKASGDEILEVMEAGPYGILIRTLAFTVNEIKSLQCF